MGMYRCVIVRIIIINQYVCKSTYSYGCNVDLHDVNVIFLSIL